MRYVILGAAGQLGRDLGPRLSGEVIPLTRELADLTFPQTLRTALTELRPAVIVNCAAYNFVDRAETEPEAAFAVNAWGVRNLALVCRDLDITLVHFSTDYAFGLESTRIKPYSEQDLPGPVSVYGLSKLAGEYLVRSLVPRHFVIRTCGLYGAWGSGGKGGNFVETMLRLARQGKPLRVVADQVCTPSYTIDIATATAALIETEAFGLYHVTSGGSCSWHELARTVFEQAGIKANLSPTTSRDYGSPARRPAYSVLSNVAIARLGITPPRPWHEALAAYLEERKHRRSES
jgi:dTDP-4-dehydrorhamnose reductase